jgi:formylglycine-generating enzyme required for sulfatase activity
VRRPPAEPVVTQVLGPSPAARPASEAVHGRLGGYEVVGELGRGGMGVVYEAQDLAIQRPVAIKVLHPGATPDAAGRFVAEARIIGQLEHPNIVPVHALGITEDGRRYFAMRKVAGTTLLQVLRDPRAWTRHRLLVAFVQVCRAVAFAHERGVVHRDLKPSNLLLGEFGEVFVVDWGVATVVGGGERPGTLVGTPGYIAPEQVDGGPPDPQADVWSLGAVLHEILAQKPAIAGRSTNERLRNTLVGVPRLDRPDLPDELAEIVAAALAPKAFRTASATALADDVDAFLEGTRRQAEAARLVGEARDRWAALQQLEADVLASDSQIAALEASIPTWAPLADKAGLFAARERRATLDAAAIDAFEAVIATCERALARDPDHADARAFLADVYFARFTAAEARGDAVAAHRYRARVEAFHAGKYAAELRGDGVLSLTADPPAPVVARRLDTRPLVWSLEPPIPLGVTPVTTPLAMGSWVLDVGGMVYPVHITRGRRWQAHLERPRPGPEGFAFVPGGPFVRGGDPEPGASRPRAEVSLPGFWMQVLPVTMGAYCAFLDALPLEQAWERAPRLDAGLDRAGERMLAKPAPGERWRLPEGDAWGRWSPEFPVHSVSWEDAVAYAAWRGPKFALPTEDQFEKAARGVDGRTYPWGDGFDPCLCKMNASRPGTPELEPVGAFPSDVSVYGIRDLAGSMRCWCADPTFDGDPNRRVVRGGSYATNARVARAAVRYASPPRHTLPYQGIRLVWTDQ